MLKINKELFKISKLNVDSGYRGTNFDRPELKRVLKYISNKKVDIVIVKDLSRLGRNYLEVKVITGINNRQAKKIDKLNRKYIYDLINMIYLNQDDSIKIEFKRK